MMKSQFDYDIAFSRNIGWFTESEQALLKTKTVAIGGLGGVGGSHLLTLARLGIQHFHISDFDRFGIENFNRQVGARMETVDQPKLDTLVAMAKQINPEASITPFPEGISEENLEEFLDGVDLYVDGLDFFALDIREKVFKYCHENNIPAVTAAPLGMGTAILNFLPGKMTFEEYFGLSDAVGEEKYLRFFIGLSPARLSQPYLVDPSRTNLAEKRGPSTIIGCELCAGGAAAQAVKILLNRGKIYAAPHSLHFDAYRNKFKVCYRPWGAKNPLQQLSLIIGRKFLAAQKSRDTATHEQEADRSLTNSEKVIELAKWAPSGDNTQTWKFTLDSPSSFTVIGNDTRDWVVYDLKGHASHLAIGALLESISLAAKSLGFKATIKELETSSDTSPQFKVRLTKSKENYDRQDADILLAEHLKIRTVQRRPMPLKTIPKDTWDTLESYLPDGYSIQRLETHEERWNFAKLTFSNAKTRLTIPEGFNVHSKVIEWNSQFSKDKIPDKAVGMNPLALKLMPWVFESWERVEFFNNWCLGTLFPRVELDLIPGFFCSSHVILYSEKPLKTYSDFIDAGKALQRFWLGCSQQGLSLQPEMTPLIFAQYLADNTRFTETSSAYELVHKNTKKLKNIANKDLSQAAFICRIGYGPIAKSRSTRLSLSNLISQNKETA